MQLDIALCDVTKVFPSCLMPTALAEECAERVAATSRTTCAIDPASHESPVV